MNTPTKPTSRVAVITGAAGGIGFALSKACLAHGLHVVMADVAVTPLCDAVESLSHGSQETGVVGVVCDVGKPERVAELARQTEHRFGRVDWLFNNAGIFGDFAPVWELDSESLHRVLEVNLYGALHVIKSFMPMLLRQDHPSRIINMASLYGLCSGSGVASYAMSKHALLAMSESLYFDLRRLSAMVGVSVVCPSFVNTALLNQDEKDSLNPSRAVMADLLSRARSPEEVADHIVQAVEKGVFYILPDREVKGYCEDRARAIVAQTDPNLHSLEKVADAVIRRSALQKI